MDDFAGLIEYLQFALLIVDPEGRIAAANQEAERLFGYGKPELLGQPVEMLVPRRLAEAHAQHRAQAGAITRPWTKAAQSQLFALRRDQTEIPVAVTLSPVVVGGAPVTLCTVHDQTAVLRQQQQGRAVFQVREAVWRMREASDVALVIKVLREQLRQLGVSFEGLGVTIVDLATGVIHAAYSAPAHLDGEVARTLRVSQSAVRAPGASWQERRVVYRPDLHREDLWGDRVWADNTRGGPVRSVVDVPFSHGTLALNSTAPDAFSPEAIALLEEMAGVLSEGFHRLGDLQALERRAAEAEALAQAISAVANSADIDQVLQTVVEQVNRVVQVERVTIFLYDATEGVLVPRAQVGHKWDTYQQIRLKPGEGISGKVLQTGEAHIYDHRPSDGSHSLRPENRALLEASVPGAGSHGVVLPLKLAGRVIGTLSVGTWEKACTPTELSVLARLASQAALAIERFEHLRQLEDEAIERDRQLAQQQAVAQVRQAVWQMDREEDIEGVIKIVNGQCQELGIPFDVLAVNMVDDTLDLPEMKHFIFQNRLNTWRIVDTRQNLADPRRRGPVDRITAFWRGGQVVYRPDLLDADLYHEYERMRTVYPEVRAVIDVPFSQGTLALNSSRPHGFDGHVEVLRAIAAVLSEGFGRMRDLLKLKRLAQARATLNQVLQSLFSAQDLHQVFGEVVRGATFLTGAERAAIFLVDSREQCLVPQAEVGHHWETYRQIRLRPGEGFSGQVLTTGNPVVGSFEVDGSSGDQSPETTELWNRSLLRPAKPGWGGAVPLRENDRIIGTLSVGGTPFRLDSQDLEHLEALGHQAVLAIQLMRNRRRDLVELGLQRVRNVVLAMRSVADWSEVARAFEKELRGLVRIHRCNLQFVDPTTHLQTGYLYEGTYHPFAEPREAARSLRQVVESKGTLYRANRSQMEEWGDRSTSEVNSIVDTWFAGGTLAMNSVEEQAFDEEDLRVLESFAPVLSQGYQRLQDLEALEAKEAQLRQSQKLEAVGQLTAGIAHNFNNMLQGILLNAQWCQNRVPEALQAPVAEILACAERSAEMIQQLMFFSRRPASEPSQPVDLAKVVAEVVTLCRKTFGGHLALATEVGTDLPHLMGDSSLLTQVLLNLMVNARDAVLAASPPEPHIQVSLRERYCDADHLQGEGQPGLYLCLEVEDNGIGMDLATQARIFEPFFTTKEVGKGTGLGLSTTFGIVRDHGGWIECRSTPGQGATFSCLFPATQVEVPPVVPAEEGFAGHGEIILLIEDEPLIRRALGSSLGEFGYQVIEGANGQEGVELARRHNPDLVMMDWSMPGLSGPETLAALRRENPDLKIVICSGHILEQERTPVTGILQKPVKISVLLETLHTVLTG